MPFAALPLLAAATALLAQLPIAQASAINILAERLPRPPALVARRIPNRAPLYQGCPKDPRSRGSSDGDQHGGGDDQLGNVDTAVEGRGVAGL